MDKLNINNNKEGSKILEVINLWEKPALLSFASDGSLMIQEINDCPGFSFRAEETLESWDSLYGGNYT